MLPQEEDPEKYQVHFASYVANDLDGDSLEDMYKEVSARAGNCAWRLGQSAPSERAGLDWGKPLRAADAPACQPRSCGTL